MADAYHSCLVCPITFSLFCDPVTAEDGHTYERSAITDWIQRNDTSPLTRTPITIEGLRPNHLVRSLVNEFQKSLSKHHYKFKLGIDIDRSKNPFFQTTGKSFFDAHWIGYSNGPPIVLLKLYGARAEKEAAFYEQLTRHSHIVYTYGLVEHSQQRSTFVMLLQEKAPIGSLYNYLEHRFEKQPNKPLSDILLNHMFIQITDAMVFLTENGIIHGDLACRNVLIFRIDEEQPIKTLVKLTDFGISRGNSIYSKIDAVTTVIDTVPIRSAAPEALQDDAIYSEKSDIYAMGVLMWEAYSNGKLPWEEISKESLVREKVINGERLTRPKNCQSDRQWELILKCMSQIPNDRPTFRELEKQLKEFTTAPTSSNASNLCQSKSAPKILTTIQQETKKIDESPRSSIIIDETEQIKSDSCQEPQPTSSVFANVNVKYRRSLFEKKTGEHQSKPDSSSKRSPRLSTIERIPPPKELIKLTKWH